jgi:hypothetical protein
MNDQGRPSFKANRNSGSKLNLLPPLILKLKIAAGFPNEKAGINEKPLLVTLAATLKLTILDVLSV